MLAKKITAGPNNFRITGKSRLKFIWYLSYGCFGILVMNCGCLGFFASGDVQKNKPNYYCFIM
jgi:hypothetical protein